LHASKYVGDVRADNSGRKQTAYLLFIKRLEEKSQTVYVDINYIYFLE